MMADETVSDRVYYDAKFRALFEKLDALKDEISTFNVRCAQRHGHDDEVMGLVRGNGERPLAVRLKLLEQAEPRREKATSFWIAIGSLIVSGILVLVESIAAWFRK